MGDKFRILLQIPVDEQKGDLNFYSLFFVCFSNLLGMMICEFIVIEKTCPCLLLILIILLSYTVRCTEVPDTGSCRDSFTKWYYNPLQKDCFRFNYGGCQGNENRFESKEQCTTVCHGVTGGLLSKLSVILQISGPGKLTSYLCC